jgi:hypothetical protein
MNFVSKPSILDKMFTDVVISGTILLLLVFIIPMLIAVIDVFFRRSKPQMRVRA